MRNSTSNVLTLPVKPLPAKRTRLKKATVLLVEDSPIIQHVHTEMLQALGWQVDIAATGQQAIDLAVKRYDLILMDIGLPDISGIQATAAIRQAEIKAQRAWVPIVALTAFDADDVREECQKAGMNGLLAKPLLPDQLRTMYRFLATKRFPE